MNSDCSGDALASVEFEDGKCMAVMSASTKVTCPGSAPCFSRLSTVCKVLDAYATPATAFSDCFGEKMGASAERVATTEISAGDLVLSTKDEISRVIVNQHKQVDRFSKMVNIEHENGSLELTPDHVLLVDGAFVAARNVVKGASLSGSTVSSVSHTIGGIINPVTTSGKILIAGMTGEPVVSSTYPEWIAEYMIGKSTASLSSAVSYLFPGSVQAFWDNVLEAAISDNFGAVSAAASASPLASFLVADVALVAGFVAYSALSLPALAALVVLVQAKKAMRKA